MQTYQVTDKHLEQLAFERDRLTARREFEQAVKQAEELIRKRQAEDEARHKNTLSTRDLSALETV